VLLNELCATAYLQPMQLRRAPILRAFGLDEDEQKANKSRMDDHDCLAHYAFVVARIGCRVCNRRGSYRLARLAAKFGPDISLPDLTDRFSYDCMWADRGPVEEGQIGLRRLPPRP
jgi:hypothetical protein